MDSALLDQVRHLCRDRAAYERLKAILVQQERVHQLNWENRYKKLIPANSSDLNSADSKTSDIFNSIIAREKALAQLADAIQRSPSLELVLQIAVQVAQKLLQVDRVAIFRAHPDGRGEFAIDAIAAGVTSLADMPERQLSLARHVIEHSAQTIDSIRSSSLSSHIVTLLEQIGISSYAANKIYAGQEVWGTLVAFEGGAYHSWSESDRTSLSLIAAQIGIAISLTDLRQQSQELTDDLQILQIELDNLQQTVAEIAESTNTDSTTNSTITSDITPIPEAIAELIAQDVVKDEQIEDFISNDLEPDDLEPDDLEPDDLEPEISQVDVDLDLAENIRSVESAINAEELFPMYVIVNDDLKVASFSESEQEKTEQVAIAPESSSPEIIGSQLLEVTELEGSEQNQIASVDLIEPESQILESEVTQIDAQINAQINNFPNNSETAIDEEEEPVIEPKSIETILEIAGNDLEAIDFLLNAIDSYLEDAPRLVQAIDKAIAVNDRVRLLQSLNTLRSSSHHIGALKLSYQCGQLESAVKANYVVLVYACLSQVAIEVQRVTDALRIEGSRYSQNSDRSSPK